MKRIRSSIETKQNVRNISISELSTHLYQNREVVFDLSFPCALCSCRVYGFDNFLKNERDFIDKFREIQQLFDDLSGHTLHELIDDNIFRHCHKVAADKQKIAKEAIGKLMTQHVGEYASFGMIEQNIDGEELFQIGTTNATRLIGTLLGNVFKILLVDYYHNLHSSSGYNTRTKTTYKFSI